MNRRRFLGFVGAMPLMPLASEAKPATLPSGHKLKTAREVIQDQGLSYEQFCIQRLRNMTVGFGVPYEAVAVDMHAMTQQQVRLQLFERRRRKPEGSSK